MKEINLVGHQGDVVIFEIDEFPDAPRAQDELTKNHQVALGELSGHNHYFSEGSEAVNLFIVDRPEYEGLKFADVKKDTPLVHGLIRGWQGKEADQDYHSEVTLKEGKRYMFGIVEETDWLTKTIRRVMD